MASKRRQQNKPVSEPNPAPVTPPKTDQHRTKTPLLVKGPHRLLILGISFLIAFVFYGNTLKNGYAMDDELVTLNQKNVEQGIAGIPGIFKSRYSVNAKQNYEYRPIVLVTYALEYQFFGRNVAASHFFNIVFYALTGFLIYLTIARLFKQQHWSLPLLTMLLFMVHPVHSEVVASLKNRDEMLALIFALLSLNAFLKYAEKPNWKNVVGGIVFFLLAYLSKRSSMPFLFIIPFTVLYMHNKKVLKTLIFCAGVLVVVGLTYAITRKILLPEKTSAARELMFFENPLYQGKFGIGERLLMALASFGFYIKMFFAPYPLVLYYGYNTFDGFHFGLYHVIGLLGFVALAYIIWKYFRTNRPLVWGAIVFVAGISMFTNLAVPAVGIVAERFAFESSLGLSLMLAVGILALFKSFHLDTAAPFSKVHNNIKVTALVLTVISAIVVIPRNKDWKNHVTTYRADIEKVPNSAKLNSLLGTWYAQELQAYNSGQKMLDQQTYRHYIDSCIYFFNRSLAIYPNYIAVNNNLGTIYTNFRYNLDSSLHYFSRAVQLDPEYVEALGNYAASWETKSEIENEKLTWINSLPPVTDSAGGDTGAVTQLAQHNELFLYLWQMKANLVQVFEKAVSGQSKGDVGKVMSNVVNSYSMRMLGQVSNTANQAQMVQALLNTYSGLARSGQFERAYTLTDSVTAVYFNPEINRLLGVEVTGKINTAVKTAITTKREVYRERAWTNFKKSLSLKKDNGPLYAKMTGVLQRWNRLDDLIWAHQQLLELKNVKIHAIEFKLAQAYFMKNDFANGYQHTQKALNAIGKFLKRTRDCKTDFVAAGNQFTSGYITQVEQASIKNTQSFILKYDRTLRQHNMVAEAEKLVQQLQQITKGQ